MTNPNDPASNPDPIHQMHDAWTESKMVQESDRRKSEVAASGWERDVLKDVVMESLKEQRRSRRWGIFFKLLGFGYVLALLLIGFRGQLFGWMGGSSEPHTAVVDVAGVIASDQLANAANVLNALESAFEDPNTKGVILRINSPGGSPVQAGMIYDEITRLRAEYPHIPVHSVVADICASGGYYVAVAGDRIFADKASIVGSIGVRMDGFGFTGAMEKLGVERRLLTAGENKGLLDPFSPVNEEVEVHLIGMLDNIHQQFIDVVKEGRGDRLKAPDEELFTGFIWTGEQAVEIGLVDSLGNERYVARAIIGAERLVNFSYEEDIFGRLTRRLGASIASHLTLLSPSAWTLR